MPGLPPVDAVLVERALALFARHAGTDDDDAALEADMLDLAGEPMLARRLIDFLPEAFALLLMAHLAPRPELPRTFKAQDDAGTWHAFDWKSEPVFVTGLRQAQHIFHAGPRNVFQATANRSAMLGAVSKALNAGESLEGGQVQPPCMLGVPAELYGGD